MINWNKKATIELHEAHIENIKSQLKLLRKELDKERFERARQGLLQKAARHKLALREKSIKQLEALSDPLTSPIIRKESLTSLRKLRSSLPPAPPKKEEQ